MTSTDGLVFKRPARLPSGSSGTPGCAARLHCHAGRICVSNGLWQLVELANKLSRFPNIAPRRCCALFIRCMRWLMNSGNRGTLLVDFDKTPRLTGTRHNIVPSLVSHLLIGNSPSPDDYTYPSNRIVITEWPLLNSRNRASTSLHHSVFAGQLLPPRHNRPIPRE